MKAWDTMPETEPTIPWEPEPSPDDNVMLLPFHDYPIHESLEESRFGAVPPGYVRVGPEAVSYASNHRYMGRSGLCLKFVRLDLNIPSYFYDARSAYGGVNYYDRHSSSEPKIGSPVFYLIGNHWHVVLYAGNGKVWGTDAIQLGRADLISINAPVNSWGARRLGWTETLNKVRAVPDGVIIDASHVKDATKAGRRYEHGRLLKKWVWAEVKGTPGHRRMNMLSNTLGGGFRTNAALVQRKSGVARPYDGLMGVHSLTWLAHRHTKDDVVVP